MTIGKWIDHLIKFTSNSVVNIKYSCISLQQIKEKILVDFAKIK